MNKPRLEAVSRRAECCATCEHWRSDKAGIYCPQIDAGIVNDLLTVTCRVWSRAWTCSDAIDLYEELRNAERVA